MSKSELQSRNSIPDGLFIYAHLLMDCHSGSESLAIVLTGTIIPNTALYTKHFDAEARRREYLAAIHLYLKFAPVIFLENSSYNLSQDTAFESVRGLTVYQLISPEPEKGKGFQEFNMLDQWIQTEANLPKRWIKITGRYFYPEFEKIWQECCTQQVSLIINQYLFANRADTALFCINTEFYREYLLNLYSQCDDAEGRFIETVLSKRLRKIPRSHYRRFMNHVICTGISGHTAKRIDNPKIDKLNAAIRDLNYKFDQRYIWLSF